MTTQDRPRRWRRTHAGRLGSLLCGLALATSCAPAAQADFTAAPVPGTGVTALAVLDLASWAAIVKNSPDPDSVSVTGDRGATWTPVAGVLQSGDRLVGLAAAPRQTYRAVVLLAGVPIRFQVKSITREGVLTNLGPPTAGSAMGLGTIAVDEDGATWVPTLWAFSQPNPWGLVRVSASGEVSEFTGPPAGNLSQVDALRTPDGIRVWAHGGGSYRLEGTALVLEGPEPVLLRDGPLVIRPSSTSFDGGAHWLGRAGRRVVRGSPDQPATTNLRVGRRIATRFDARQFRATPPRIPDGASTVVSTGAGYVAWGPTAIAVHDGPLPAWPASLGVVQPDTVAMLARANGLRADVGLPPLVADATISQAARNHANYDKQWNEAHSETSGRAGFTGASPAQRCAFVGTACGGEVMTYVASAPDAIDDWVSTPFHRPPILDPRAGIVGAAQSAGPAPTSVLDTGDDLQELVAPVGYPQGTYRGPVAFYGETPDPAASCAASGQPVSYPLGAAISLFAPGPAQISGVREVDGAALRGCVLGAIFLPEDPLAVGHTYEATGTWDIGDGARLPYAWTFTARPDAQLAGNQFLPGAFPLPTATPRRDSTKPVLSALSLSPARMRAARRGSSIAVHGPTRVTYTLSEPATVRFTVQRVLFGRRVKGRCVASNPSNRRAKRCTRYPAVRGAFSHKGKAGRNAFRFSGRVSNRKLAVGRYRLHAVATDAARNASPVRYSPTLQIRR